LPGYLRKFLTEQVESGVTRGESLDARTVCTIQHDGIAPYVIRVGRYGPFVEVPKAGSEKPTSVSLPEDIAPADITREFIEQLAEHAQRGDEPLGVDPKTSLPVYALVGRFGPYVQLGDADANGGKPKRASLPKGVEPTQVTLSQALALLALPRDLGAHPETGDPVRAGLGQFGPYVVHQKTFASLKKGDDVLTVTMQRALELFEEKAARGPGRGRGASAVPPLRTLGAHPSDQQPIVVMEGRYGAYVKHGDVNATLPDGVTPETVSMEQAIALLAARASSAKKKPAARGGARSTRSAAATAAPEKAAALKKSKPAAKASATGTKASKAPAKASKPAAKASKPAAKASDAAGATVKAPRTRKATGKTEG
jgi:DNA topoisomerase-1